MRNIKPYISKIAKKNVYEYKDNKMKTSIKVAGFDISMYDPIRQERIRKRYRADYQTVMMIVDQINKAINSCELDKIDELIGVKAKTLGELFAAFKIYKKSNENRVGLGASDSTIKRYRVAARSLTSELNPDINGLKVSLITQRWIERKLKERVDAGKSLNTINSDITHLKSLFKWGVEHQYLKSNPFINIPRFKVEKSTPRILTNAEWNSIWDVVQFGRWRPLILMYLLTGARLSEILKPKLEWNHIDFKNQTIKLFNRKRNKKLILPMPKILEIELLSLKEHPIVKLSGVQEDDSEYLFPFNKDFVSKALKRDVFYPAGITDVTTHDLRRTFGSYLLYLGWPLAVVSKMMSHSSVAITEQTYLGQLNTTNRTALNDLAKYLLPNIDENLESAIKEKTMELLVPHKDHLRRTPSKNDGVKTLEKMPNHA